MEHFENTRKCTSNAVSEDPQQTSIEQLPNEVLAQIFYWVIQYDDGTDNDPGACRCDDDGLDMHLMLSLVCSRWNAVTSSTPELWTGICNEDSLECTKLFLERSKSFPLDIRCHWRNQGRIASFMNLVLPHIGRWRSFWSSSQYFSGKLDQYFTQYSAPILESFSLNTPYVGSSATDIGRTQWISQILFNKSAPLLKHLEIETDTISWSDPVIRGMSSLGVMDYGENEETSFWRYNCLLSGNQSLESLSIRRRPHPLEYAHARIPPICTHEIGPHANLRNAKLVGHTLSFALGAVSSIPSPLHPHPSIEILHCNVGQWVANARSDKFIHQSDSLLSKVMSSVTRFDIRNHVSVCLVEGFNENESGKTRVFLMAVDERLPPCSWLINALFPLTTDFSQLRALQLQATAASPGIDAITERLEGLPNLEDFGLTASIKLTHYEVLSIDAFLRRLSQRIEHSNHHYVAQKNGWLCPKLSRLNFVSVTVKKATLARFIDQRYMQSRVMGERPADLDVFRIWGSWPEVPTGCAEAEEVKTLVKQTGRIHRFLWT